MRRVQTIHDRRGGSNRNPLFWLFLVAIGLLRASTAWIGASAQGDLEAPVIVSIAVDPVQVYTALAPAVVTVTAHITDDLSGIDFAVLLFEPEIGTTQRAEVQLYPRHLVSGTLTDGLFRNSFELPRYAAEGAWRMVHVYTADAVGNYVALNDSGGGPIPEHLVTQSRFHNGDLRMAPAAYLPAIFSMP